MVITEISSSTTLISAELTFADRVDMLLQQRGCTKAWLARELGISRQALNQILNHNKKAKFVSEIARAFNVRPQWLTTGEGQIQSAKTKMLHEKISYINVYSLSDLQVTNSISKSTPIDQITVQPNEKLNHFAIQLKNCPSMSEKFPENTILIFESKKNVDNGEFILAKIDKQILFRQYFFERDTVVLKPISQNFESIKTNLDSCKILGVLKETRIRF